jgi:hypothetical protein
MPDCISYVTGVELISEPNKMRINYRETEMKFVEP